MIDLINFLPRKVYRIISVTCLFLLVSNCINAQIIFEKGYFIDNNGNKVVCLIKNIQWFNNPKSFSYKLSENGPVFIAQNDSIQEFSIDGYSKYIRAKVKIDNSPVDLNNLSNVSFPDWSDEALYLNVLVEGKATLYLYEKGNMLRFFYSIDGSAIQQLIYKEYINKDNDIFKNNGFQQQLFNDVKLPDQSFVDFRNLVYTKNCLRKFFLKYNSFYNSNNKITISNEGTHSIKLNLKLSIGANYSDLHLRGSSWSGVYYDFPNLINSRIGLEAGFTLPFNKNKWCALIEPTFQQIKGKGVHIIANRYKDHLNADCNFIEFPVGIRYNSFLNNDLAFFISGYFIPNLKIDFNSKLVVGGSYLNFTPGNTLAFGGGLQFHRFNAEARYYTNRNIIGNMTITSNYSRLYFILGYRFL